MSARAGEERLLSHFADVHYYFSAPGANPLHHRFDKGSYVYLFRNASQDQARLEVANNAGTSAQDAFSGYLNSVVLEYSDKHPTLLTITVNGRPAHAAHPVPFSDTDWTLPAPDPRNEGKYMFKIHTLDVYLWKQEDTAEILGILRDILPASQLKVLGAEGRNVAHHDVMSPVVQKLEQAAVSDPKDSSERSVSANSNSMTFSLLPSNVGPPMQGSGTAKPEAQPTNYAPLPYNPTSPAAPEPIKHREKTPPPPESVGGTGLAAAEMEDSGPPYAQPSFPTQSAPPAPSEISLQQYVSGTPQRQGSFPPPPASTIPPPGAPQSPSPSVSSLGQVQRTSSFPPPPPQPLPNQNDGSAGPPPGQQYPQSFASPPQDSNARIYGQMSPPLQSTPPPSYHPNQAVHAQQQSPSQPQQPSQQYANYPQSPGYFPAGVQPSGIQSSATQPPGTQPPGIQPPGIQPPGTQPPGIQSPGIPPPGIQSPGMPSTTGYSNYQYGQPQQSQHPQYPQQPQYSQHPQQPQQQPQPYQQQPGDPYGVYNQAYRPTEGEAYHGKPPAPGAGQPPMQYEPRTSRVNQGVNKFLKKLDKKLG
ncbi:MAG: hypothetical protein M1837_006015 [Sclerophora amabilis]|nr:MAG: hypothetical protein M1837_006015 [Sclerophora amabilis]